MKDFVKDNFFSKGHYFLKFSQTFLGIFMWVLVFIPIAITFNSVDNKHMGISFLHRWYYREGFQMFNNTSKILLFSVFLCVGVGILLTIRNNFKIKHQFKKKITYDTDTLDKKLILLEQTYKQRFGAKEEREQKKFYSVQAHQNIDADYIQKLYKEERVD